VLQEIALDTEENQSIRQMAIFFLFLLQTANAGRALIGFLGGLRVGKRIQTLTYLGGLAETLKTFDFLRFLGRYPATTPLGSSPKAQN